MKRITALLLALIIAVLFTACGESNNTQSGTSGSSKEESGNTSAASSSDSGTSSGTASGTDYVLPAMKWEYKKYTDYINYRHPLKHTYDKLTKGETLNVAYFGGSVTSGTGSDDSHCWRGLVGQWLENNFKKAKINNLNFSWGDSGLFLGLYRLQRDVISKKPDLLFLEYSINDLYNGTDYTLCACRFETAIREIRAACPKCDIVCILVTNQNLFEDAKNGKLHEQAQAHEDICAAYNIPSIHVGRALVDKMGSISNWSQYVTDSVHPNSEGYKVYFNEIEKFLQKNLFETKFTANDDKYPLAKIQCPALYDGNRTFISGGTSSIGNKISKTITLESLLKDSQKNGGKGFTYSNDSFIFVSSHAHNYNGMLTLARKAGDGELVFEIDGTEMVLLSNVYDTSASFLYSVDGSDYKTCNFSAKAPTQVFTGLSSGKHTVKLKFEWAKIPGTACKLTLQIGAIGSRDVTKQTLKK